MGGNGIPGCSNFDLSYQYDLKPHCVGYAMGFALREQATTGLTSHSSDSSFDSRTPSRPQTDRDDLERKVPNSWEVETEKDGLRQLASFSKTAGCRFDSCPTCPHEPWIFQGFCFATHRPIAPVWGPYPYAYPYRLPYPYPSLQWIPTRQQS